MYCISSKNAHIYSIIWPPTMVRNSDPTRLYALFHTYQMYSCGHLNLVPPWCVTLDGWMQLYSNLFDPSQNLASPLPTPTLNLLCVWEPKIFRSICLNYRDNVIAAIVFISNKTYSHLREEIILKIWAQ